MSETIDTAAAGVPAVDASPADLPATAPAAPAPQETQAQKDAAAFKRMIAARLTPGVHPTLDSTGRPKPLSELYGVGQCDGVFYLSDGVEFQELPDGEFQPLPVAGFQREALQYLRPMPKLWHAKTYFQTNTRRIGVSYPEASFLITPSMQAVADRMERKIKWLFTCDEHCIHAVQPKHRDRFRVFPVTDLKPEGIWAVLYI